MTTLALALLSLVPAAPIQRPPAVDLTPPELPTTTALTTGGLVWSSPAGNHLPVLALGDRGGQIFALMYDYRIRLFSSFDADPPEPVWTSGPASFWVDVAAASESDLYLHLQVRTNSVLSSVGVLRMFRSRSEVPAWRFQFPEQIASVPAFDLSRDGETIVSAFANETTSTTELRVHDPVTGEAVQTHVHPAWVSRTGFDLSPDGLVSAFSNDYLMLSTEVYETATGAHLASLPGNIFGNQALSNSGGHLATFEWSVGAPTHVRVHARGPGGYQEVLDVPMPAGVYPRDLAVSDDGTTMAASWWDSRTPRQSIIRAYDLATGTMTMERIDTGTTQDVSSDSISIAADGSRFVVGLWGAGSGAFPELSVYSPTSSTPLRSHATGGAVYQVDLSPDGKRYAATRTPGNRGYFESSIEMYEFGGEDLVVRGTPSVGAPITFELHAAAGARAWLLCSFTLAPNPIDVPGVGTLHLDRGTLSSTSMGVVPASGVATYSTVAATVPGMIGRTLWFQGLTSRPRHLTTDFVQLTILP